MKLTALYRRSPSAALRALLRHMAGKPPLRFGHRIPDIHNTNPLAPARLTISVVTELGSRSVVTSALPRGMASAIALGLAAKGVHADVRDDRGVHTVADLVRRRRQKEKRKPVKAVTNVVLMGRKPRP